MVVFFLCRNIFRLQVYHLFGWFWLLNFVIAFGQCVLAGAFASYYWAWDKKTVSSYGPLTGVQSLFENQLLRMYYIQVLGLYILDLFVLNSSVVYFIKTVFFFVQDIPTFPVTSSMWRTIR